MLCDVPQPCDVAHSGDVMWCNAIVLCSVVVWCNDVVLCTASLWCNAVGWCYEGVWCKRNLLCDISSSANVKEKTISGILTKWPQFPRTILLTCKVKSLSSILFTRRSKVVVLLFISQTMVSMWVWVWNIKVFTNNNIYNVLVVLAASATTAKRVSIWNGFNCTEILSGS